jgi:hypothetical protein
MGGASTSNASAPGTQAERESEPKFPFPASFWWFKRLTLAGLALLVCLAAVRVWWGREADRRLRLAIDELVARGSPARAIDLNPQQIPDSENAAFYLRQAAGTVNPNVWSPANSATNFAAPYTPHSNGWGKVAGKSVAANTAVFPLARQARAYNQFDWGLRVIGLGNPPNVPQLNPVRTLANTLGDSALYAHEQGDDVAALETIRDLRHISKGTASQPLLISGLVGIGIDAMAMARLHELAPGLRIADQDAPPPSPAIGGVATGPFPTTTPASPQRAVTPSHVRALIGELLDERDDPGDLRAALAGERVCNIDALLHPSNMGRVVTPMIKLDAIRVSKKFDLAIAAAAQPTLPAARAAVARPPASLGPPVSVLIPSLLRANEQGFHIRNERRMAAVSLAARLYHAEHGTWPPTPEALVPKYLPKVPRDALAPGDQPLRYVLIPGGRPDGADRPLVYSVGEDGVDDTAAGTAKPPAVPNYSWVRAADQWRDLSRWPPPPPPAPASTTTQPAGQ